MKALMSLAALILIAVPAQASTNDLLRQEVDLTKEALAAAKVENWSLACRKYKEYVAFKLKNNLHVMKPLTGSQKAQELTHKSNVLTAKINSSVNSNGSFLCKNAGIPWTTVNLQTTYTAALPSSSNNVSSIIRTQCVQKWGTDYRMIKYCIDKQSAAAQSLGY